MCEGLEGRTLLATAGTDYVLSGYSWSNPGHITYSIAPDGVRWDQGTNNLNATFNANLGNGAWQREIARALATWESVANINIVQVPDSSYNLGVPGRWQGDPRFGDIRIGGYPMTADMSTLAQTILPSSGSSTAAGDLEINTAIAFHIGSDYDLYSVALHETGHSLGLEHAPNPNEVMYYSYSGVETGLAPGDIAGIQAIYGPRTQDVYQQQGQGLTISNAVDLTSRLGSTSRVTLNDPSLATVGDTEYFRVVAPAGSGMSLQVQAIADGVSLLSPKVSVLDASGTPLDVEGDPTKWGDTITASVNHVVPGQTYLIAVTGATHDVFSVGAYHLQIGFTGATAPLSSPSPSPTIVSPSPTIVTPSSPSTQASSPPTTPPAAPPAPAPAPPPPAPPVTFPTILASPIAPDGFEPNNTPAQATPLGAVTSRVLNFLTLNTAYDVDNFTIQAPRAGTYLVTAPWTIVRVLDSFGNPIAAGLGQVTVPVVRKGTMLDVQVLPPGMPVANYTLAIALRPSKVLPTHVGQGIGTRRPGRPLLRRNASMHGLHA